MFCFLRAPGRAILVCCALLTAAGCSSTSRLTTPTIPPARTFSLARFTPLRVAHRGPARLSFTINQPSGAALTDYRRGAGPHTGVHLIIVRDDLSLIIHRHPPIGAGGQISETIDFPSPGPYRVLVDAYPAVQGAPRNFQLHEDVRVAGRYHVRPLPRFSRVVTTDGYRISLSGPAKLHAITPTPFTVKVTTPTGQPAQFTTWFGALAHAIFFRAGSLDYFHTHVCSKSTTNCTSILAGKSAVGRPKSGGRLQVVALLPIAGTWRLFLQCQVGGRILTAPFTLQVT